MNNTYCTFPGQRTLLCCARPPSRLHTLLLASLSLLWMETEIPTTTAKDVLTVPERTTLGGEWIS